jgi:ribose transport system substrate-binding protein
MKFSSRASAIAFASLAVVSVLTGCSSGAGGGGGAGGGATAVVLDPADLETDILTVNPDGVKPESLEDVKITDEQCAAAKAAGFTVGVAMHVMSNEVPQNQVKGMKEIFDECGVTVVSVTDANFSVVQQTSDIENMIQLAPDGIISVPTDGTAMGAAYKGVQAAGIKLVLSDIYVDGLESGTDYTSLVGSDIRSAGQIAGQAAAAYVPDGGTMGFVDFGIQFFATNERTTGAQEWVTENRPDIKQELVDFTDPAKVEQPAGDFLTAHPDVDALYTVWDAPAQQVMSAERGQGVTVPVTTVDLGTDVALEMAKGGLIKAVGAQLPFEEGNAQAYVMIRTLLGEEVPVYVVTPSIPVVPANLTEGWKRVWRADPPKEIVDACKANPDCN